MDYEKLGLFYLGVVEGEPWLYDARDLLTHAVIVGMTGSGKTGLGITLLEEAALDGVPALVIDPKGDLANLALQLDPRDPRQFRPWIDPDAARRAGLDPEAFAAAEAERWGAGLARSGQGPERLERLRAAAEVVVYTPGSSAVRPLSVLASFARPAAEVWSDPDLLRARISTTVSSLLALLGLEADPVRSREHVLLSTLLERAWRAGQDLDLAGLVAAVHRPALDRIGALPLEAFYPASQRGELAIRLNNLVASPAFQPWLEGEPLDVAALLRGERPRLVVLSIAHLGDAERMFFVSLLLGQLLGWMRSQPGTDSLRAVLYMDEVLGYLPPVANPPSKLPFLTLLKQARAYGLGLVLATQNPVDLDYKALSNAGTWFVGRLQTERDKLRLLDGLQGLRWSGRRDDSAAPGEMEELGVDRAEVDRRISALRPRRFVVHDVHADGLAEIETRWALSYLRGPLTLAELARLGPPPAPAPAAAAGAAVGVDPHPAPPSPPTTAPAPDSRTPSALSPAAAPPGGPAPATAPGPDPRTPTASAPGAAPSVGPTSAPAPPPVVQDLPQLFAPTLASDPCYRPALLGVVRVHVTEPKLGWDHTEDRAFVLPLAEGDLTVDWARATPFHDDPHALERQPAPGASFAPVPAVLDQPRAVAGWSRALLEHAWRTVRFEVLRDQALGISSRPGEPEAAVRARLADAAREERDRRIDRLREKHASRMRTLDDRIARARAAVSQQAAQATQRRLDAAVSVGATLLGALFGTRGSTVARASSAAKGVGRVVKESSDVAQAEQALAELESQQAELGREIEEEVDRIRSAPAPELTPMQVQPKKADLEVRLVALLWAAGPQRTALG